MKSYKTTIIEPKKGWQLIDWQEIKEYKDLLYFLVMRDVKAIYKQTVLGIGWAVIRPIVTMIVFTVIFGKLAKVPSDGIPYPIFSYSALLPWLYFQNSITKSSQILITNAPMLSKIYFPRIFFPFVPVLAGLIDFVLSFIVLLLLMLGYGMIPTLKILWVFPLIILMMLFSTGLGLWFSSMGVYYRDVRHANQFLGRMLMYMAPVVWPVSLIPDQYRLIYGLYPMGGVIEGFRAAIVGVNPMPWDLIGVGFASAVIIFVSGLFIFKRMEKVFADVA